MNTRESRKLTNAAALAAVAVFMSAGAPAIAQGIWGTPPPPEGPPQAPPDAPRSLDVPTMYRFVSGVVGIAIGKANAKLSHASISFSYDTSSPRMLATQYKDRPNEFYANIPFNLTYSVSIQPVGPNLTITQSSNIQVSCEGWQTGSGTVTQKVVFGPAYFDPEQYNNLITAQLQSQIQAALTEFPLGAVSIPNLNPACGSLGAYTNAQDNGVGDEIVYGFPLPHHVAQGQGQITVRVLQVRRLPLEDRGAPEYEAVETPYLQLWANESFTSLSLPPMMEGQTFVPTNTVVQTLPLNNQLVLIANMQYSSLELPIGQTDATFAVFGKSSNFGNGTLKLTTPKYWTDVYPPLPHSSKPNIVAMSGGGYEVTLQIAVPPGLQNLAANPGTPVVPVIPFVPIGGSRQ